MVGRKVLRLSLIAVALLGARSVAADPSRSPGTSPTISIRQTNPGVVVITDHSAKRCPIHIAQPAWMTDSGLVSGLEHQGRPAGLQCRRPTPCTSESTPTGSPATSTATGHPGSPDPQLTAAGGTDPANFGGDKSMAVGFAPLTGTFSTTNLPAPVIVAGIPGDKAAGRPGSRRVHVAKYAPTGGTGSQLRPRDQLRQDAHGGHGQPRVRSQRCSIPASSSRSPISASFWAPIPRTAWSS